MDHRTRVITIKKSNDDGDVHFFSFFFVVFQYNSDRVKLTSSYSSMSSVFNCNLVGCRLIILNDDVLRLFVLQCFYGCCGFCCCLIYWNSLQKYRCIFRMMLSLSLTHTLFRMYTLTHVKRRKQTFPRDEIEHRASERRHKTKQNICNKTSIIIP